MTALDRYIQELARIQAPSRVANDQSPFAHMVQGVVEGIHLGGLDIRLRGQAQPAEDVRYLTSYRPGFGDVVWCLRFGSDLICLGDLIHSPLAGGSTGMEEWREVGATGNPAFENSWVWYGAGRAKPAFAMQSDGWVRLKGTVKTGVGNTVIFTLPPEYRPPFLWGGTTLANGASCSLNINAAGQVWPSQGGSSTWTSLDGLTWPTIDAWERDRDVNWFSLVRSLNGWKADAGDINTMPQIYRRQDGWRYLKGNVEGGTATAGVFVPFTDIPPEDSVLYGQMFMVRESTVGPVRVDLRGTLSQWGRVTGGSGLVLLPNINYFSRLGENFFSVDPTYPHKSFQSWTNATLENGWINLGGTADAWRPLQYMKDDFGIVHLRGMIMGTSKTSDYFTTLPEGYLPDPSGDETGGWQVFPAVRWDASGGVVGTIRVDEWGAVHATGSVANWHSVSASWKAAA